MFLYELYVHLPTSYPQLTALVHMTMPSVGPSLTKSQATLPTRILQNYLMHSRPSHHYPSSIQFVLVSHTYQE
jgi:hypothetical protein